MPKELDKDSMVAKHFLNDGEMHFKVEEIEVFRVHEGHLKVKQRSTSALK